MINLIVLNYNDYQTTSDFIDKIRNYNSINKVIIVDNNSTDGSYDILKKYQSDKIDIIKTDKNRGYSYGNDFGVRYALEKYNPEYIIISNPDVEFEEKIVLELKNIFVEKLDAGVVTCLMKCPPHIKLPVAWKLPKYVDCLIENTFLLKKILKNKQEYKKTYINDKKEHIKMVEVIPGSFFMINADVYNKINGFDTNTFLYYEENILAKKIKDSGLNNYILNSNNYFHNHSVSINKSFSSNEKKMRICFESKIYFCQNYLNVGKIKIIILKISFYICLVEYKIFKKIFSK